MSKFQSNSLLVLGGRVFWMMLGPMMLVLLTIIIATKGQGWFTPADIAFLAVLGGLLLARWVEFRAGDPRTSTGEPAAPGALRRYVLGAVTLGFGVWIVANLVGNHWLTA